MTTLKNKKYGFRDFIRKSYPLERILSYTPLTRRTFTNFSQLKVGMKVVYYTTILGNLSKRRTDNPKVVTVLFIPLTERGYITTTPGVMLLKDQIFFYEEEKALGRVE